MQKGLFILFFPSLSEHRQDLTALYWQTYIANSKELASVKRWLLTDEGAGGIKTKRSGEIGRAAAIFVCIILINQQTQAVLKPAMCSSSLDYSVMLH